MISRILLTFCSFIFTAGFIFAESDTINQVDGDGMKQGYWVYYGKDRPTAGFPENGKIEEGFYVDNRKNGTWKKYFDDGKTIKLEGVYKNNRPAGKYSKYYKDSKIKEEGSFHRNRYSGVLKRFHENGEMAYFGKYNDEGKSFDTAFHFFANGCLELMYVFHSDGTPKTSNIYYADSCNVMKSSQESGPDSKLPEDVEKADKVNLKEKTRISTRFKNNNRRSAYSDASLCSGEDLTLTKRYNDNGEIIWDGMCKSGKVWDGKMYFYDEDGILLFVEIWKNGEFHSDGVL